MSALLALSDVLVCRAHERAFSRDISGDARNMAVQEGIPRHRAYERFPIAAARHTHALADAWYLTPELAYRWQLPVAAAEWASVLDHYSRSLLTTRAPHTLDDLEQALRLLGAGHAV